MVKRAKPRLVEGPLCDICGGALDIKEVPRESEGSVITHPHRDGELLDRKHKGFPVYKVLRP